MLTAQFQTASLCNMILTGDVEVEEERRYDFKEFMKE